MREVGAEALQEGAVPEPVARPEPVAPAAVAVRERAGPEDPRARAARAALPVRLPVRRCSRWTDRARAQATASSLSIRPTAAGSESSSGPGLPRRLSTRTSNRSAKRHTQLAAARKASRPPTTGRRSNSTLRPVSRACKASAPPSPLNAGNRAHPRRRVSAARTATRSSPRAPRCARATPTVTTRRCRCASSAPREIPRACSAPQAASPATRSDDHEPAKLVRARSSFRCHDRPRWM